MGKLRYTDVKSKEREFLALTGLTVDEFESLIPEFEKTFQAHMAEWRFDGQRRTKRKYTTYQNSPLPTAEDRLLFVLLYLKGNPLQAHHGVMFGMMQGKANRWLYLLMPLFQKTLRTLGVAPSRTLEELAQRGDIVERQEAAQTPEADAPLPLFVMTPPKDGLSAPKVRRNRRLATVARKKRTP